MSTSPKAYAKGWRVLLAFEITLILVCPPAHGAQVLYGSLTGTITDTTDAIVPSAVIEALNVDTGVAKRTISNEIGIYLFRDLQPGTYKVMISLTGFRGILQDGLRIEANRVLRFDAKLQV